AARWCTRRDKARKELLARREEERQEAIALQEKERREAIARRQAEQRAAIARQERERRGAIARMEAEQRKAIALQEKARQALIAAQVRDAEIERQKQANLDFYVLRCAATAKVEANFRDAVHCERYAKAHTKSLLGAEGAAIIDEYKKVHCAPE